MKRALVFSGGGSRGAYEIGAWQALSEMGMRFSAVYGTSIGAINAALFAQGDLETAVRVWDNITTEKIVGVDSEDFVQIDRMISRKRDLLPFLIDHAKQLQMDITPLEELLRAHIDEGRVRASGIQLGFMLARFPGLSPAPVRIGQIREGQLIDHVLASASCFPIFPTRVIDGERYVDGGYYDNLPIDMAIGDGMQEIVAVDIHPKPTHPEYANMPFLTTISPMRSLGSFLNFEQEALRRNRRMGYYDTMKKYGRFDGIRYTFIRQPELRLQRAARRYMQTLMKFDAQAISRIPLKPQSVTAPLMSVVSSDSPGRELTWKQVFLRGLELAALCVNYEEAAIYDPADLTARIISVAAADTGDGLPEPEEKRLYLTARKGDRALLSYLYRYLKKNGSFDEAGARLVSAYPAQLAAALYLVQAENAFA